MEIFLDSEIDTIMKVSDPIGVRNPPYWTAEFYGFGKCIREYGYFPKGWPLMVFTDHSGPSILKRFTNYDISTSAPVVMFHSPYLVEKWRNEYSKPCYNLYSPFVYFRRTRNITKSIMAKGTLAYPAHTIPELDISSNLSQYISHLKQLPDKFQPVSISLHYHDINKGVHKEFLKQGFRVFTAGNPADYGFVDKFYSILENFKYTTSNIIGSYVFYSVEMGIPFFLCGDEPAYSSNTKSELASEALDSVTAEDDLSKHYTELFRTFNDEISSEQRSKVESILGITNGLSRFEMCKVLYTAFFNHQTQNATAKARDFITDKVQRSKRLGRKLLNSFKSD
jgi:hypothetical protein